MLIRRSPLPPALRKDPEYLKKWVHEWWALFRSQKPAEPGEEVAFSNLRRQDGTSEAARVIGEKK